MIPTRTQPRSLASVVLLALAAACGAAEDSPTQPAASAPGGTATAPSSAAPSSAAPSTPPAPRADPAATMVAPVAETLAPSQLSAAGANEPSTLAPAGSGSAVPDGCNPDAAGSSFEQACGSCAGADACATCLCGACSDELRTCLETPGCAEILACARASGCGGSACYCGSADPIACLNGSADGPCRSVIDGAPGGHVPSLSQPSAGVASDRASDVAQCMQRDGSCRSACAAP